MDEQNDQGHAKEYELSALLRERFGADCVYLSPKVNDKPGCEKELCDVLILALPYAIVFQSKWMKLTAEDLNGDDANVKRGRLVRRMQKAAQQFAEFSSSLKHLKSTFLPKIWAKGEDVGLYELPLKLIERVIPIVVVDFEDLNYDNPQLRYTDIPPVIVDAPSQIKNWGHVHSFLLKDFKKIVNQLFRVGDLILWLCEREKLFKGMPRSFVGYNELSLFMLYLINNPMWKKLLEFDGVLFDDCDLFERMLQEKSAEFEKRQAVFAKQDIVDVLELELHRSAMNMLSKNSDASVVYTYLSYAGRIKCWPVVMKKNVAEKFMELLAGYQFLDGKDAMNGAYGFFNDTPLKGTLCYFGVVNYTETSVEKICPYILQRALAYIKKHKLQGDIHELLIILTRPDGPSISCVLYPIDAQTYLHAMQESELERTRISYSAYKFTTSEWDMVRNLNGEGGDDRTGLDV